MDQSLKEGLEKVERARDKVISQQPRLNQKSVSAEAFFSSTLRWVTLAADEEPPYIPDSRVRDRWLSSFWRREPHLAGVLSSVNAIDSNRGWAMIGGRNQVARFTSVLKNAEDGAGWRQYISQQSTAYYTADIGALTETGRDGKNGPLRALYHLDPTKCRLTGNRNAPLQYQFSKNLWTDNDFFRMVSLRNILEEYRGLGMCAISRILDLSKIMLAIYNNELETLGARAPKGLLLLQNISEGQWKEAMKARDAALDSEMRKYYNAVAVIATEGVDTIDAKLVALSQLPIGFDLKVFTDLLMFAYALAFNYDPIEFWPVQAGQLGRGRETDIQHRKGTGKGGLNFMLAFQEQIQQQLPETVYFEFEQRDQQGVLLDAEVAQAWANVVTTLYGGKQNTAPGPNGGAGGGPKQPKDLSKKGVPTPTTGDATTQITAAQDGVITREEARSLLASQGVIPSSWIALNEEVISTDTKSIEQRQQREMLMENETIRRAAYQFPNEPIVRYNFLTNRTEILFDQGRDASKATRFTIVKPIALIPDFSEQQEFEKELKEWDEDPLDIDWVETAEEITDEI